jgi:hypothetical protein
VLVQSLLLVNLRFSLNGDSDIFVDLRENMNSVQNHIGLFISKSNAILRLKKKDSMVRLKDHLAIAHFTLVIVTLLSSSGSVKRARRPQWMIIALNAVTTHEFMAG